MPSYDFKYGFPPQSSGNGHAHSSPQTPARITPSPHPSPLPPDAGEGEHPLTPSPTQTLLPSSSTTSPHPGPLPPDEGEGEQPLDRVLEELIRGQLGPLARLSASIDCTLDHVAEWIAKAANRKKIANLVTLLDAQAQLLLCQHRTIAVARLAHVAATAQSPETVRRACFNLLRVRLIDPYKEDKRPPAPPEPPPPMSEQNILETLVRLSEEADARNCDDGPPPGYEAQRMKDELDRAAMWNEWNRR